MGNFGASELVLAGVLWALPLVISLVALIWFVRTLGSMAASLRTIADRLVSLEDAVRETLSRRGS